VVDLTHPANVALFRRWDQAEAAYVQMLRFVRISSAHPATAVVSRPGKHVTLTAPAPAPVDAMDEDDGEAPALLPAA
jgi:translation machinery-associated protein 16